MFLAFSKMHGLGNDFVVFDAINQSIELSPSRSGLLRTGALASVVIRFSWWSGPGIP